jgi:hypothetical protein
MDTMIVARPAFRQQILVFARHYGEMCVSMCAVGVPLTLVALEGASAFAGYDVRERFPELALLLVALTLTLPMTAWMLLRHMAPRATLEMAGAAFAIALVLIAAVWANVAGPGWLAIRVGEFCGLSCVAMFVVMLARLDLYTGRAGHHTGHSI